MTQHLSDNFNKELQLADHKTKMLNELERLLIEAKSISTARESASTLDEIDAIMMTRGRENSTQLASAMAELRVLELAALRERIAQSLASRGSGSKLVKAAGREAADLLETAEHEAADVLETATSDATDLLNDAEAEANDLLDDAIRNATDLLEEADDEAAGW